MVSSVIIDDLHIMHFAFTPDKANAPAVVYSDAVLACPVALESLKVVAGRATKVLQPPGGMQVQQLTAGHTFDGAETRHKLIGKEPSSVWAAERADQAPVYDTLSIPSRVMDANEMTTTGQGDVD
jgi:hypothetical protein